MAADLEAPPAVPPTRRGPIRLSTAYVVLVAAALLAALDLDLPGPLTVLRPIAGLGLLVVLPTWALHRRLRLPADSAAAHLAYAFGLALLGLLVGGLALDTLLPLVGIDRPLAPAPIATAWAVAGVGLITWRRSVPLLEPRPLVHAWRGARDARLEAAQASAVVCVLLAVAGAIRLNNGASGAIAVAAIVVGAGSLLALSVARGSLRRDVVTLMLVAAGLLLATSLRGWGITGHDIQAEYLAFRLTDGAQAWDLDALPSAYNACLSVTILPTVLAQATGLSGVVVFTVLLQLVFAIVPALTYLLARRMVTRRLAIAAAVLTMAFPTFYTDMPYLVRQEVAFLFLALMLLTATEPGRTRVRSPLLAGLFGVGVIASHYSTTYVLLMALVAALIGTGALALVRRLRGRPRPESPESPESPDSPEPPVLLQPLLVGMLVAITLAWAGPVTGTGGHAGDVIRDTIAVLTGEAAEGPSSSDTSYWLFAGDDTTPRERMDLFVGETLAYRDAQIAPDQRVIARPGPAVLQPELHQDDRDPLAEAARIACALLMQGFALVGAGWLIGRRGAWGRRGSGPYGPGLSREMTLLSWGAMAALGLIVVIPNLSVSYGVLRAFQQTLLIIAPVLAIGMWLTLRPIARLLPRLATGLTVALPVTLLLVLSGAVAIGMGAPVPRLALANSGTYYDRFIAPDSEVDAMHWLGEVDRADRDNTRLIASRNLNVRLLALSGNRAPVADRLYPTLLSRDAYVFVDSQILDRGVSTVFYTGDLLTYTYPLAELDRHLDLLYSGPHARVYR